MTVGVLDSLLYTSVIRRNAQTQRKSDAVEIKTLRGEIRTIIAGITPVLDYIDGNPPPAPVGNLDENPLPPDAFVERCKASWDQFKVFLRGTASYAAAHALSVVRSWYPDTELRKIARGFPKNTPDERADELLLQAEECSAKLVDDLRLFEEQQ